LSIHRFRNSSGVNFNKNTFTGLLKQHLLSSGHYNTSSLTCNRAGIEDLDIKGSHLLLSLDSNQRLIQDKDGTDRLPAVEILINSPKVSKHIENGEIKEIVEEMENSVTFYHMQSMNQSLIALLAHNRISYDQALDASSDPDDLSLKLREMFPSIEERFREGEMAPSPADFSQITELLETKQLYEEIIEKYPQSEYAKKAKERLPALQDQ